MEQAHLSSRYRRPGGLGCGGPSGGHSPGPVRALEIAKDHGAGVRTLGVADTVDRVAQTAAAMLLDETLEPIFHPDSYGYRPGRSAHDALAVCKLRCWRQ